jgi:hypothetical protein
VIAIEGAKAGIQSNVLMPVAATRMTEDLLGDLVSLIKPELVTPLVTFLASEACTFSHEMISAVGGRYARVFIGLAPGWYGGKDHVPTAEDVLDNLAQIEKQDGYIVPTASSDELSQLLTVLGG